MNLAAIIIVALSVVAGAGLGFALTWAASRFAEVQLPVRWVALGGAALGALVALAVVNDWASALRSEAPVSVANVLPYIADIKTREPTLYERIETSVIRDRQDGKEPEEIRANARSLVTSYVADKIPFLPDDLTYEVYATTRDSLAYLAAKKEFAACAELARGHAKSDIDTKLPPELVERTNNNILRVITTAPNRDATKMPAEEFAQLTNKSFADASQATGIPPEEMPDLLSAQGDPTKACRLMKAFFDALLSQPVEVAAAALRSLASGEGQ